MRKTLATIILIVLAASYSYGQSTLGTPLVVNYHKTLFYGGTRTWDIRQDSKGIMYFANDEGLVIFNGNSWKLFQLPNKTILRSIAIDENDRIYAGAQDEIGYFEPGTNNILQYASVKKWIPQQYRNFADIWNTVIFDGSVFFRATDRLFRMTGNRISVYLPAREWLFLGKAGKRLFAQDKDNGLLEYKKNQWLPLKNSELLKSINIAAIFQIEGDKYVITTISNHSFLLQTDSIEVIRNPAWEDLYTPSSSKINDSVFATATAKEGCIVRDLNNHLLQRISVAEGLENNNATTVFVDKDKNIWTGVDNAIAVINYSSPLKYIRPSSINDVVGYSTLIFKNELYVSSSNGVFVAPLSNTAGDLSLAKSSFSLIKGSDYGESWQLQEVNQEILMAHNGGSYIIKDKKIFPLSTETGAWTFLPLSSAYPAQNILTGTYWGFDLLRYTGGRFSSAGQLKGVPDSYRFLAMDENGDIWASHPYRGIYRLKLSADSMKYTARLLTSKDGLPSSFNNYVFRIKNRVVFSTEAGVYEFNPVTNKFVPSAFLSAFNGITVRYMKEDSEGNIWFCSGRKIGVARFFPMNNMKSPYFINYFPELEGYVLSKFDNIYPYNKENIFVGSEKGIININYEKYTAQKLQPAVLLNEVKVIEKKDSILFGGAFHKNATEGFIQEAGEIHSLPSSFNSFHIEYSSPAYGCTYNIEYSYRLEGYDEAWSAWSTKAEKDYTNLPDGDYTFKVKARNNLANESEVVAYSFVIRPPWFKTIWAKVGYFFILCAVFFLLSRWYQRKILQLQKKFEGKQKQLEYLHQLQLEKNEKEIIKLQNEKLVGEVALKKKELASATMQLEGNNTTLNKLKDEIGKLNGNGDNKNDIKRILTLIKDIEDNNVNWDKFASHFDEVNHDLLKKLKKKYPKLSQGDLKICAYLHLRFSSKQISQLNNISVRSVEIHRHRVRKKLGLETGQSISDFLENV